MKASYGLSRVFVLFSIFSLALLAQQAQAATKIDLNSATSEQLQELPGIGEAYAKKIIAGRPYKSVEGLAEAGIPEATITKIKTLVTVKAPAKPEKDPVEKPAGAGNAAKVDLNTASAAELEELPGVGTATAKKIIAGRPYKSVDDLAAAGVSAATIAKITPLVSVKGVARATEKPEKTTGESPAKTATGKLDLNSATATELEELPGVGTATAKKIIAGRPYKSVDDLADAGVNASTIAKITPLVSVKAAPTKTATGSTPRTGETATPAGAKTTGAKVDLNSATAAELEELPGIGEAYAKKIIAGRPYKSIESLEKAGIPASAVEKIKGKVSVEDEDAVPARTAPAKGMVWLNTESKVYHKEGSHWYGKTKQGEFMTEQEAIKAGGRAAKDEK